MNQVDQLKAQAAPVAGYYDALTALVKKAEADAGLDFDRQWHCLQIATAAMYLTFQHGAEYFSILEANRINGELHDALRTVYELLGHDRANEDRTRGLLGDNPDCWPDPFD